ncbi:GntP family permease [Mucilaginibacter sabulilitoris]|uniref:GntP family permease n=1 Tax=Mucilaginibacter sabulilitoris TaxID=1173583 RepID=A0ABZ0TVL8_9SPHI|nr:GntP family permease [Mucilaginibacter sabulilitoris]WPU96912.1 GntP family permease [Mucilaginibacter sabulilitoris]
MDVSLVRILICLIAGIAVIVLLTAKFRVHAFFALIIACFLVGLGVGMRLNDVLTTIKDGFGNILKSLGLLIVLGTTLGAILEHTGSTKVMANTILKIVGEKYAALAMSLTGFIVGLPIFCDSGYIVLSGLNKSLAKSTGISLAIMSTSLATGLYAVHCMIPPHPGAAAAAGIISVDFGRLMLTGIMIAIPAMISGYLWSKYAGKKIPAQLIDAAELIKGNQRLPSVIKAFMPVVVPIFLIALKSFFIVEPGTASNRINMYLMLGDPEIALAIGVLFAFNTMPSFKKDVLGPLLQEGAEKAGGILVIIGAGGAFGAILAATKLGTHLSEALPLASLGILFPFLLTSIVKTAQGSSTVAIITAASIILPLLHALGLDTDTGRLLCVLSMGAGSMMISHANDAYFWVIAKFSGLEMKTMLKVYSLATVCMGLTALAMVYIVSFII